MKKTTQIFLFLAFLVTGFMSCKKDEKQVILEGGTAPVLKASVTGAIPLSFATQSSQAIKLTWTNPNYKFNTGVSSHDVNYTVEFDTVGANFTNPAKKTVSISKELERTFTQAEINDYLLNQLVLSVGKTHRIEVRVVASLNNGSASVSSNVLKFDVIPYSIPPKVDPPAAGNLWIVGDATPNGWANPLNPTYEASQKFTKVSNTLYELTIALPGGGGYKLLQDNGVWGTQYHMLAGGTWEGGDFEKKDSDPQFPGPPSAGTYKITVDFQRGKFNVVKL